MQQGGPILHAESDCIRNAGRIGSYVGTGLYSTLMPCPLCSGAAVLFKIPRAIVGENAVGKEGGGNIGFAVTATYLPAMMAMTGRVALQFARISTSRRLLTPRPSGLIVLASSSE